MRVPITAVPKSIIVTASIVYIYIQYLSEVLNIPLHQSMEKKFKRIHRYWSAQEIRLC